MLSLKFIVLLLVCARFGLCNVSIELPEITLLQPKGIRMAVKDPGPGTTTLVAFHYSINTRLAGVDPGDWNYDVRSKTGGLWVHENRLVDVQPGDTVYYWIYAVVNGLGWQVTDKSYTIPSGNERTTSPPTQATDRPTEGPTEGPTGDKKLELILDDDFSTLDLDTWRYEVTAGGGGNWEFQVYTPEERNVYVKDNTLFIRPTLTADRFDENFVRYGTMDVNKLWGQCTDDQWWGCLRSANGGVVNPIMSGKIRTKMSFKYGRVEVVAKMPRGDWIWPAIWLMPQHNEYGGWPRSGEIDVCESRGNEDYGNIGVQEAGVALHWGTPGNDRYLMTNGQKRLSGKNFGEKFVKYTLDWDESGIKVYYDDELIMNAPTPSEGYYRYGNLPENPWQNGGKAAPFDKEFYLILNVAVGGTNGYFPDSVLNRPNPKPWSNTSPRASAEFWDRKNDWYSTWNGENTAMQIKSVKIWKEVSGGEGVVPTSTPSNGMQLILEDNFSTLDLNKWRHEVTASGGGNWEFQVYTPEERNVYVRDNTLFIKPTLTADRFDENFVKYGKMDVEKLWGKCTDSQWFGCNRQGDGSNILNPIMSGKIRTKVSLKYGRVEVVAKMPKGDWIWPAIWMLPEWSQYGGWPRSGEIDICESRGNNNYGSIGVQEAGATLHWGTPDNDRYTMTQGLKKLSGQNFGDKFIKYTTDWDATGIRVYFDDELVLNAPTPNNGYYRYGNLPYNPWTQGGKDAPFDKEFYLILNVAVGGTNGYFPDSVPNIPRPKPWKNNSRFGPRDFWNKKNDWYQTWRGEEAAMQIKSVKIWKKV